MPTKPYIQGTLSVVDMKEYTPTTYALWCLCPAVHCHVACSTALLPCRAQRRRCLTAILFAATTCALQAPKPDFFEKTLPLFDVNDNIGMVLTPTQFSNTPFATDIFNRNNVMGWWYKQPRYDGWSHIDAMRGNVLIRSKALMEVTCWSAASLFTVGQ